MTFTSANPQPAKPSGLAEMLAAIATAKARFLPVPEPIEVSQAEWDHLKSLMQPHLSHVNAERFAPSFAGIRIVLKT